MSFRTISVTVVHGDYVTRTGLTSALSVCNDMRVRATTADDPELLSSDVVVADFDNGMRVLAASQALAASRPRPKVAIVAMADLEWQIRDALEGGAAAFMLLAATPDELFVAVRTVHRGGCHLNPAVATKLAASLAAVPLTTREAEVLALVTDGLCNKRVAARLDISIGTVKAHLRSAFDKLGVHSRTEAVLVAVRRGMLRRVAEARVSDPEVGPETPPQPRPLPGRDRHADSADAAADRTAPFDS